MGRNSERLIKSLAGGVIATLFSVLFPLLAWPLLIFDPLFPPQCPPEALLCLWSDEALAATLATEVLIYSLLTYLVLKLNLLRLERASYVGKV
jgi:hypothetical protein